MQTIEDYVNAYGRKSREEFIRDVPCPLLVYRGAVVATEPDRAFRTTTMTPKEVQRLANAVSTTAVLRVVKKPEGPFPNWISLGRTRTADITLEHSQISKFHAYFTYDDKNNQWMITDAGSTNGTAVESQTLPAKQSMPLKDGTRLNFGTVQVVFRLPGDFHDYLVSLSD